MNHISASQMNIFIGPLDSNDDVYIHNITGMRTDILPVLHIYCRINMYSKYDMTKYNIVFGPVKWGEGCGYTCTHYDKCVDQIL